MICLGGGLRIQQLIVMLLLWDSLMELWLLQVNLLTLQKKVTLLWLRMNLLGTVLLYGQSNFIVLLARTTQIIVWSLLKKAYEIGQRGFLLVWVSVKTLVPRGGVVVSVLLLFAVIFLLNYLLLVRVQTHCHTRWHHVKDCVTCLFVFSNKIQILLALFFSLPQLEVKRYESFLLVLRFLQLFLNLSFG